MTSKPQRTMSLASGLVKLSLYWMTGVYMCMCVCVHGVLCKCTKLKFAHMLYKNIHVHVLNEAWLG